MEGNIPRGETGTGRFMETGIGGLHKEHKQTLAVIVETMEPRRRARDESVWVLHKGEPERSKGAIRELCKERVTAKAGLSEERKLRKEQRVRMKNQKAKLNVGEAANLEQRERDELDLKNAGYDPHDGQNSATMALSAAVRDRKGLRIINLLLAKGANPALDIVQPSDRYAANALHRAAGVGYADAVCTFIERNPSELDRVGGNSNTALIQAAWKGHEAAVKVLLEKGAKLDTRNEGGNTGLILAADRGHEAVVHLLLMKGAKSNIRNAAGETALICAASSGHEDIVRLLLMAGADQRLMTNAGDTALV